MMSKSKGNVVEPWGVLSRFGADAFRWFFFTSKQPWDGYRFSIDAVGEATRKFLTTVWAVHHFHSQYRVETETAKSDLDRWILSRLATTVTEVTERLEAFDATFAGRARGGEGQAAPAAARGCRRGGGARARGDRAPRRCRARRAQRQGAALRRARRRAGLDRGQAELPRARAALRQGHAEGGRSGGRP